MKNKLKGVSIRGNVLTEALRRMKQDKEEPNDLSYWLNTYLRKLWKLKG